MALCSSPGKVIGEIQQVFHENSLVDIVNIVQGFPADFTTSLFTRENEPLIGADHVLAAMATPSTVISKV